MQLANRLSHFKVAATAPTDAEAATVTDTHRLFPFFPGIPLAPPQWDHARGQLYLRVLHGHNHIPHGLVSLQRLRAQVQEQVALAAECSHTHHAGHARLHETVHAQTAATLLSR